jgi:hypothetical protein
MMSNALAKPREPLTNRLHQFLGNAAASIDVVALEVGAHGLKEPEEKLRAIARVLRERKTQ